MNFDGVSFRLIVRYRASCRSRPRIRTCGSAYHLERQHPAQPADDGMGARLPPRGALQRPRASLGRSSLGVLLPPGPREREKQTNIPTRGREPSRAFPASSRGTERASERANDKSTGRSTGPTCVCTDLVRSRNSRTGSHTSITTTTSSPPPTHYYDDDDDFSCHEPKSMGMGTVE